MLSVIHIVCYGLCAVQSALNICMMCDVDCVLYVVLRMSFVVFCIFVCCMLSGVCCLVFATCLYDVCCRLHVALYAFCCGLCFMLPTARIELSYVCCEMNVMRCG